MKLEINIPEKINVKLDNNILNVKGPQGEIEKEFKSKLINISMKDKIIYLETINERKNSLSILNTTKSLIENMFSGTEKKYTYVLRGVYSHFPLTLSVKGDNFVINNYLGEKNVKTVKIPKNVEVSIKGKEVYIKSVDKALAGNIAGLIENSAKVLNRDRRIFQDGIYIITKGVQNE